MIEAGAARLDEQRLAVLADCVDLELRLGREQDLVGELTEIVAGSPLRERLVGQLMTALYRSGRQADALRTYQTLRKRLSDELGVDPSTDLQKLHTAILRNEGSGGNGVHTFRVGVGDGTAGTVAGIAGDDAWRRNQLPRDVGDFTGRGHQMAELISSLAARVPGAAVAAIFGKPGVGKTALAVHVGHRLCGEFPDGQLFLNLGGMGGRPVPAEEALMRILHLLGVGRAEIPRRAEARAEMYRAHLATRRLLIVLDNVADEARSARSCPRGPARGSDHEQKGLGRPGSCTPPFACGAEPRRVDRAVEEGGRPDTAGVHTRSRRSDRRAVRPASPGDPYRRCKARAQGALVTVGAGRQADRRAAPPRRTTGSTCGTGQPLLSYQALDPPTQQLFGTLGLLHTVDSRMGPGDHDRPAGRRRTRLP